MLGRELPRVAKQVIERNPQQPRVAIAQTLINDPAVRRFLPPGPHATLEMLSSVLERRRESEREHCYAMWAVDLKESGTLIGQCGFFPAEGKGPEIEVAYHFQKAVWNQGYATEAVRAVLGYALETLRLERAIAVIMAENIGSQRVVEKAGMRFEGIATYYGIENVKKYVAERVQPAPSQT